MKVIVGILFAAGALGLLVMGGLFNITGGDRSADEFLRLHVRAHSNSTSDQVAKYAVKQAVLNEFAPIFSRVTSKEQAMETLNSNIRTLEIISNDTLITHGKTYTARVFLRTEHFPTRDYHGHTLPAGIYDALIIELGDARGDNWWCVVYPPLCFLDNNIGGERGVVYRSRLMEIINRFF